MKKDLRTERKKLTLHRETLRFLQDRDLRHAAGQGPESKTQVDFDSTIAPTGCC